MADGNKAMVAASSTSRKRPHKYECPISIQWTIAEEKLEALKDSTTNGCLETEWFNTKNILVAKYQLQIYPNEYTEAYGDNVMVYLHLRLGYEIKVKADVKFSVESAGFTKNKTYEYEKPIGWGYYQSTTTEFFDPAKKFLVDGKFTLKCEGLLYVEREKNAVAENRINFGFGHIGHKLWENDDKDFTIKVDGSCIKVHKNVLAAQSPVFKAMFVSGMKESKQNQMEITDFSFKIVEDAIQILYTIQPSMDMNDKMGVLQFCDKYDIADLKTRIETSLIRVVSASTVCELANSSIISNAFKLQGKCAKFLTECIKSRTPVTDIDFLDKDFALKLVSNALVTIVET